MLETHQETRHNPLVTFLIDHKKYQTHSTHLSVREILTDYAKENPEKVTLALKHGKELNRYDNLDTVICIENGMQFVVLHETPTQVS
jgi:hypothetical protein